MLFALFNQALGFNDLAALELAVFVGLLQHIPGFIVVVGADYLDGNGQRNVAALISLDQSLFTLVEQKHDVIDVFW